MIEVIICTYDDGNWYWDNAWPVLHIYKVMDSNLNSKKHQIE